MVNRPRWTRDGKPIRYVDGFPIDKSDDEIARDMLRCLVSLSTATRRAVDLLRYAPAEGETAAPLLPREEYLDRLQSLCDRLSRELQAKGGQRG